VALENISLAEKMAERMEAERHLAQEMDIARRVQARLLPQRQPKLETQDYVGRCIQARQVGGDYYDFLELRPGRVALVLADIAGKGISGALLMANLQANLRSQYAMALEDPRGLLVSVNRLSYENTTETSYATLSFSEYLPDLPAIMCSRTRSQLARLEAHPTDGRRPFKLSPEVEPSVSSFDIHLDFCRTDSSAVSGGSMASRAA
jgi:hypothetical protein